MAFEDYKDLDLKPEKATREEIEQLSKKYGVSEFHDVSSRAREFLRRKEEKEELWTSVFQLLTENFPNDSKEEREMKLKTLRNYDESWYGKEIELYVPKFHDVILRVGIRCKGTDKVKFFMTDAEKELRELLKL